MCLRVLERAMKQVRTSRTSTLAIMRRPEFGRGFEETRTGLPARYDDHDDDDYWAYERGRMFGYIAPLSMPLRINGKINPKALALCEAAFSRKLLI